MSFTISTAAWVAVGVLAAGTAYEVHQGNVNASKARTAAEIAKDQQAAATAKASSDADNEANALRVSQKRAYQANALALGGTDDSLGGSPLGAIGTGTTANYSTAKPTRGGAQGGSAYGGGSTLGGSGGVVSIGGGYGGGGGGRGAYPKSLELPF